ncbi:GNVR domain-containing protein (plasmid) [Rhizobium sp. 32-5/1]|uniref:GumC family protein n=1 Tax=Rhizobium sp. 32-5/1 TaxID=3019602 RepID=UPI00240E558B|nr:GNVR domain-containing protein [Rhizobium sp. 32-5/1]WEZ85861.1 GNVR domain-containing protein [Rhizobium sp. 32-5/1]
MQKHVSVVVDEKSFMASLSVYAQTAAKAIEISEALVEGFQVELATADSENAARTARALDDRLGDLKRDVLDADERVENYKRAHKLSIGDNGGLVSAQTLTQLNNDIIAARTRAINAQSSYDEMLKAGNSLIGSQAAVSPALTLLLQASGLLQQQYEDQAAILGPRHPSIVRLQARRLSMQQQVGAELERVRSAAKAELDKANATVVELTNKMNAFEDSTFDDNQSQIELRELQRDVAAKTAIYESFLSRTRQITEREQINTNNVRVISEPLPPSSRSWPPSAIVFLILGGIAGAVLGIGLSLLRGIVSDMRTPSGIRSGAR